MNAKEIKTTKEYIATFTGVHKKRLLQLQGIIKKAAPGTTETISYGIPTFQYNKKNLIHFAAFTKHVSIFPGAKAIVDFENELHPYKTAKGTVQFPLSEPLPEKLITAIVTYRLKAEAAKQNKK